jgi:hypothetical protein
MVAYCCSIWRLFYFWEGDGTVVGTHSNDDVKHLQSGSDSSGRGRLIH